jgi:peptidyl-Lys metalloendopeptidase
MIFAAASLLLLAASGAEAARSLGLTVNGADSVTDVDNFAVVATITNTGDETLKLYRDPRTALSSFPEDTFSLTSTDGAVAEFIGAHVKYTFKTATNFVTLAPGASVDVTHKLAAGYNFTRGGDYDVDVANLFHYQDSNGAPVAIRADVSSIHSAKLSGNLVSSVVGKRSMDLAKRAKFASCSSTRQSQINTALTTTTSYVANAVSYLTALSSGSTRYTTWFGTYSSSRKSTVLSHYTKIKTSDPKTYTYDCSCTDDYYAYVYPNNFGYVYLCNAFWTASTTGTDSKAGTIVHESSHFTANGGTQDYVYGQTGAKNLAKSNPSQAIMNADSHEYFAENTPAQS